LFDAVILADLTPSLPGAAFLISGWGIFGLILLALFILLAIIGYFTGVPRRMKVGLAAKQSGNLDKAADLFTKVLAEENADWVKNLSGDALTEHKQHFARAHLELGEIHEARGEKSSAEDHFKKAAAAGIELSSRAVQSLGRAYAAQNDTSEDAIKVYLHFIKLRPRDSVGEKVYAVLESACRVEESQKADKRKKAVELNQRVLNANPKLDWAHFNLGLAAFISKEIDEARTQFTLALKLNPAREMTYYWLGLCRLRGKKADVAGATEAVEKFLSFPSDDKKFLKRQGRAAFELAKHIADAEGLFRLQPEEVTAGNQSTLKRILPWLQTATQRDDSSAEYFFCLGRAHSLLAEHEPAVAALELAVQLAPQNADYSFYLGAECVAADRLENAASALLGAVKAKEDFAEARALLADVCLRTGNFTEAEEQSRRLLELRANQPGDLAGLVRALYHQSRFGEVVREVEARAALKITTDVSADAVFCIGHSYLRDGQPAKALVWFESVPKEPRTLFNFACALAHAGLYDHAHSKLDELFTAPNGYAVRGYVLRGNVHLRQGALKPAEEACRKALELEPQDESARFALGCVFYRGGRFDAAREQFEALLEQNSSHAAALLGCGLVHEHARETGEAIEQYECVPEHDALAPLARLRLGILACRQMEYDRALALLAGLEGDGVGSDAHLCYLATALFQAGRYEDAIAQLQRLLERHPDDAEIKMNLARARYMLGAQLAREEKYPEACREWELYLEVCPQDEKTRKDLAQLYYREAVRRLCVAPAPPREVFADVEPLLERAVAGDPQESAYSYCYALCQMKLGHIDLALARLQKLSEAADRPAHLEYHIGLCLLQKGKSEEALGVLKRSARDPSAPHAQYSAWAIANLKLHAGELSDALKILSESL
jgi:tetratricopeptide (TPR) repeat protein